MPDCIKLTPWNIDALAWMPKSCAYRRLHEGRGLPDWHPLVTGDPESTHKAGVSVRGQTINETCLADPEDALDFPAYDLMRRDGECAGFEVRPLLGSGSERASNPKAH